VASRVRIRGDPFVGQKFAKAIGGMGGEPVHPILRLYLARRAKSIALWFITVLGVGFIIAVIVAPLCGPGTSWSVERGRESFMGSWNCSAHIPSPDDVRSGFTGLAEEQSCALRSDTRMALKFC
jgi:hypothetical protein